VGKLWEPGREFGPEALAENPVLSMGQSEVVPSHLAAIRIRIVPFCCKWPQA